jgi:NADH:ubiquinone oxidoreductase subunit F (NADH-binding)
VRPTVQGTAPVDGSTPTGDSFFHLAGVDVTDQPCQGTACFVARHRDPDRWARAVGSEPRIYCLGRCHAAPATADDDARPDIVVDAPEAVVLERVVAGGAPTLAGYRAHHGLAALENALALTSDQLVAAVERSGLRGRGGAAFPTGQKWRAALAGDGGTTYVVANADEGDPGAYIDRVLLEDDPHAVLEGLALAALAVGARTGFVYVRKEYPRARARIEEAVREERDAGVLGEALLGDGPPFDVEIVDGAGSYVCGEETALLNAIEGRRPEVRARPPYPTQHGLFGQRTVVNNVETLAALPWIVRHGGAAYAELGTTTSAGTKVLSLNSLFRRPGLYEVELGLPVRDVVDRLGGGIDGELRGLLIGGPLAGVLHPSQLDTPLEFEAMRAVGCEVGHGGVVAFDERTSIADLVHHVFRFGAYESCGKCTPCREGAGRIEDLVAPDAQLRRTGTAPVPAASEWAEIVAVLEATSLCGHGTGLGAFARSIATSYRAELDECLG